MVCLCVREEKLLGSSLGTWNGGSGHLQEVERGKGGVKRGKGSYHMLGRGVSARAKKIRRSSLGTWNGENNHSKEVEKGNGVVKKGGRGGISDCPSSCA